jgi:RNA polymerase sigma factor (sigma-70 family)
MDNAVELEQLPDDDRPLATLVGRHPEFLAFVERRVDDSGLARDILQTAFLKAMERLHSLRDDQSVAQWFYRILRNDLTDHHRRGSARRRALEQQPPSEPTAADSGHEAVHRGVPCRCVSAMLSTLPPQYASIVQRIDLDGSSVSEVAREQGLSANNVRVRLHRARRALRKQLERHCGTCAEERCRDCTCHPEHALPWPVANP